MRYVSVLAAAALVALPCAASPLTAAQLQARFRSEARACPAIAPKLTIERLAIVGADQHDRIRRDLGQKTDGQPGQRYVIVYVRDHLQVAPVASLGPVEAGTMPDDLRSLRDIKYCSVDEG